MARTSKIIGPALGQTCSYGCGGSAIVAYANGKFCCQDTHGRCPAVVAKNAAGVKRSHASGKRSYDHLSENRGWSKGLTRESSDLMQRNSDRMIALWASKERLTEKEQRAYYRAKCSWDVKVLNPVLTQIPGYQLFVQVGMYNKHTNKTGVVRDHRLSIWNGFKLNVDPALMRHPANCRFLLHEDNAKKSSRSELTLDELKIAIVEWNNALVGELVDPQD